MCRRKMRAPDHPARPAEWANKALQLRCRGPPFGFNVFTEYAMQFAQFFMPYNNNNNGNL